MRREAQGAGHLWAMRFAGTRRAASWPCAHPSAKEFLGVLIGVEFYTPIANRGTLISRGTALIGSFEIASDGARSL